MSDITDRLRHGFDHKTLPHALSGFYHETADYVEDLERKFDELDAAHVPTPPRASGSFYCADDGFRWPCRTHRILHPEATP